MECKSINIMRVALDIFKNYVSQLLQTSKVNFFFRHFNITFKRKVSAVASRRVDLQTKSLKPLH